MLNPPTLRESGRANEMNDKRPDKIWSTGARQPIVQFD